MKIGRSFRHSELPRAGQVARLTPESGKLAGRRARLVADGGGLENRYAG